MKRYRITIATVTVVLAALLALWAVNIPKQTKAPKSSPTISIEAAKPATVAELLQLVNEQRAKVGVAPLVLDERLNQSAQRKADDMVKYDYNAHISPHDGKHGYTYANETGIRCKTVSENLHWGDGYYLTSAGTVDGWMGSQLHKEAMLNKQYSLTGLGIAFHKNGQIAVVEHFCEQ